MVRSSTGAERAQPAAKAPHDVGTARTLTPNDADVDTLRETLEHPGRALAFPKLDGEHERRMEDLLAARLFPRQAAPTRIGRYALLDRLGQGGMGVVYAAYDPELDRRVAIKLLTASPGQAEARLLREAQAMARVAHANVVSVIEVGAHHGQTYVVMEYLRGISLERWPERRPGWRATVGVYVQAGRGLAAAHRAGVIHRDFKPHNVMLVEGGPDDGRVKVLDFGLARAARESPTRAAHETSPDPLSQPLTRTGAVMGTPAYMAPEQFAGQTVDERSDQFSFAVSLYEALHGQLPFASDSLAALSDALLSGTVRPPPASSDVPAWVQRVVLRGLARAPADRFPSMSALCDALERDPAARRRSIGLSVALSALVGAGAWSVAQRGAASPCHGPAFTLREVWNDARAAAMTAALTSTGLPYAAQTAARLTPILDNYAGAWSTMRSEACEAHRSGEQSATLLDLRMACLDRRRAGLVTLTDLLTQTEAPLVERAVEAALALPSLNDCADVTTLSSETPPPDDPASAREVAAARDTLAEIHTLTRAGQLGAAETSAERTLAQAEALGFRPLIAESALARGSIALEQGRAAEAEAALSLAVRRGIEGRADRTAAEAVIRRHFVRGVLQGKLTGAEDDDAWVAAHAARFPSDGALRWLAANNRGVVAHRNNDVERARNFYREALAVPAGPTPLDRARTRVNLGLLEADARDFAAALVSHRAAIAEASEALGESHPLVLELATYEAAALDALGHRQAARERLTAFITAESSDGAGSQRSPWPSIRLSRLDSHFRRRTSARTSAQRALAAANPDDVLTRLNAETAMADALTDPDAALTHYAGVLDRCQATYGEHHPAMASFLQRAAAGMLRLSLPTEAREHLRRALVIGERLAGSDLAATAETHRLLADAALALADPTSALASATAAVTILTNLPGDHSLDLALARRSLARAHLARGELAPATTALRAALAVLEPRLDPDDPDLAATRSDLAGALVTADPTHPDVPALLTQARDVYAALGEPFARERHDVEQRLAATTTPHP